MANTLVQTLIDATELPAQSLGRELEGLFQAHGTTCENITLEELRVIMADYLQTVLLEAKEELSA